MKNIVRDGTIGLSLGGLDKTVYVLALQPWRIDGDLGLVNIATNNINRIYQTDRQQFISRRKYLS